MKKILLLAVALLPLIGTCAARPGDAPAPVSGCVLVFSSRTWWPLYKGFTGDGMVRCRSGQTLAVRVVAKGPGLTIDHWSIRHGEGRYAHLRSLDDALGRFVPTGDGAQLVKTGPVDVPERQRPHLALGGRNGDARMSQAIHDLLVLRTQP